MTTISRDTISVVYEARDRTSNALAAINRNTGGVINSVRRVNDQLERLGTARVINSVRGITREIGSLAGVAGVLGGGGLVATLGLIARNGLIAGDEIAKTSDRLGVASEELTKLQFAVSQTSQISERGFNIALQRMTRRLAEAEAGNVGLQQKLAALNLTVADFEGKSPDKAFLTLSDAIASVANQNERVRLTFAFFDSEGVGLVNTLQRGSAAIESLGQEAVDLGIAFDRVSLSKIEEANDRFSQIRDVIRGASIAFAVNLAPVITEITRNILEFVRANGGIGEIIQRAYISSVETLESVRAGAASVVEFFGRISDRITATQLNLLRFRESLSVVSQDFLPLSNEAEINAQKELLELRQRIAEIEIPPVSVDTSLSVAQLEELRQKLLDARNSRITEDSAEGRRTFQVNQAAIEQVDKLIDLREKLSVSPPASSVASNSTDQQGEIERLQRQGDEAGRQAQQRREEAQRAAAIRQIDSLRASFDERLKIEGEYNRAVEQLREQAQIAGIGDGVVAELESQLLNRLNNDLEAYESRQESARQAAAEKLQRDNAEELKQILAAAEQARQAADLSRLVGLDLSGGLNLEQLNNIANQERLEIQAAVNLPPEERQQLLSEVDRLRTEGEARLQINADIQARFDTAQQNIGLVSDGLNALGAINDANRNTDVQDANTRAQELQAIQQEYNAAIEEGNAAEVASAQARYNRLNAIQQKELQAARKRFERHKKVQTLMSVAPTVSAALQAAEQTPGGVLAKIGAIAAVTAAGFKKIDLTNDLKFDSPTAGTGGVAGFSGTNPSQESITQSAINSGATGPTTVIFNVTGGLNDDAVVEDLMNRASSLSSNGGAQFSPSVIAS